MHMQGKVIYFHFPPKNQCSAYILIFFHIIDLKLQFLIFFIQWVCHLPNHYRYKLRWTQKNFLPIKASQNLSSSALSSDSVGSTMRVPTTGQEVVGEWKPVTNN